MASNCVKPWDKLYLMLVSLGFMPSKMEDSIMTYAVLLDAVINEENEGKMGTLTT